VSERSAAVAAYPDQRFPYPSVPWTTRAWVRSGSGGWSSTVPTGEPVRLRPPGAPGRRRMRPAA